MSKLAVFIRLMISVVLLSGATGCRKPLESERDNRRMMDAILTAVTTKNFKELAADEQLLESRHDNHQLNEVGYTTLKAIIAKAKSGAWQEAESDLYRIREQTPFPRQ